MRITNLMVEGVINPVGVDKSNPVFSWNITGYINNIFQQNYRIVVSTSKDLDNEIVWDSGNKVSSKTYDCIYKGKKLLPATKYYYRVYATVNGKKLKSEIAYFATGMLTRNMPAQWLSINPKELNVPGNCAYVRKIFSISDISYALLFIYSYGWYEARINGKKTDDRFLAPAKSNYDRQLFYDAYDITDFVKSGKNVLSLILADGYNVNANKYMGTWPGGKRFIAVLNIRNADGSVTVIPSDNSWKFTTDTPILINDIYNGEFYDARREIAGWDNVDFDDSEWKKLFIYKEKKSLKFYCNIGPFIKIIDRINPKKIWHLKDGRYLLDFGQNLSGFVEFSLCSNRGDRIRIKTAEEICKFNGEFILDSNTNRAAVSTDIYIFKGDSFETYHPTFTYHGFRYAEIAGVSEKPKKENFAACVLHTEFSSIAKFKTDNALINKIYDNSKWSVLSNSVSFPSDCAARDERTPCSMDLYSYLNTAIYMLSPSPYYKRFEELLLSVIKNEKIDMTWYGCLIALPWFLYNYHGQLEYIKKKYNALKCVQDIYLAQYPDLIPKATFGDWCAPNCPGNYLTSFALCEETEQYMMYVTCKMMSEMASALNKRKDADRYSALCEKVSEIYVERFFDAEKKIFSNGKQSSNIFALTNNFLDEQDKKATARRLIDSISDNGKHLDVGIFGIRNFVEFFSDEGSIDLALDCFMNPEYPSFAHQISLGATTLWEQWCGYGDMASHNHAMFAGAVSGFYTRLAGICLKDVGFKKIKIKPVLSKHINNLNFEFETINGFVRIRYSKSNGKFKLSIVIPPNCEAEVVMPNNQTYSVGNGRFSFFSDYVL